MNYKKTIAYDMSGGSVDIVFDDLEKYNSVTISCSWSLLDALDGTLKLQESDSNGGWVDILTLSENMATATGNVSFHHVDFGDSSVRLVVDAGSVTSGDLVSVLTVKDI